MSTQKLASAPDALEIVFANRNRAYGAYALRREYPVNLAKAFGFCLFLIGFFLLLPILLKAVSGDTPEHIAHNVIIETGTPPEIVPNQPELPPPVEAPEPPPVAQTRYVAFVAVDENLDESTQINTVEEVLNTNANIGNKNVEGEPPGTEIPDDFKLPKAIEVPSNEDETVRDIFGVQKPPTYPGGDQDLLKYLAKNVQYPELARDANIQGSVVITFVIMKDGSIGDVQILKDIGGGCGKEAMRVVKSMPKWSPGEANGKPVKVRFTLPVRFQLN